MTDLFTPEAARCSECGFKLTDGGQSAVVGGVEVTGLCPACKETADSMAKPKPQQSNDLFTASPIGSAIFGTAPPLNGGDGCVAYTFPTSYRNPDGTPRRSAPLYHVRKVCPKCHTKYKGMDFRWQTDAMPPKPYPCDVCVMHDETHAREFWKPTLHSIPGAVMQRACVCGWSPVQARREFQQKCPVCDRSLGTAPHRAEPEPRKCIKCNAVEYHSPEGRRMLDHNSH